MKLKRFPTYVFTNFVAALLLLSVFLPLVEAGTTTFSGWFDIGCHSKGWGWTKGINFAGDAYAWGNGGTKHIEGMRIYWKYRQEKDTFRIMIMEVKFWTIVQYGNPYPPTVVDWSVIRSLEINPNTDPVLKYLPANTPIWYQQTLSWDFTTKVSSSEWRNGHTKWYWDYMYYIGIETANIWAKSWSIGYGPMEHPWYIDGGFGDTNVRTMSRWYSLDWGWYYQEGWTRWTDKEFNIISWD